MIDWSLIDNCNDSSTHNCSGDKESFIKELQDNTSGDLVNYVTAFDIKIGMDFFRQTAIVINKDTYEETEIPCLIEVEAGKDLIQNSVTRLFKYSSEYTFKVGDYVRHRVSFNDTAKEKVFMINSEPIEKRGYYEAYIVECSHSFNMLTKTGEVVTVWLYADDNKIIIRDSSISVIRDNDISTIWTTVPDNEYTRMLGNEVKRVLIKGLAFKFVGASYVNSVNGTFVIGIQTVGINEMDNLETGIAYNEYHELIKPEEPTPAPTPPTPIPTPTIEISGDDVIGLEYTVEYTINGNCNSWDVSNTNIEILESTSNSCLIYVKKKKSLIGKVITLTAKTDNGDYTKDITIGED